MAFETRSTKLKKKIFRHPAVKAFINGFGSAITIIRDIRPYEFKLWANYKSDAEALWNDWQKIGGDICKAAEKQSGRKLNSKEHYSRHAKIVNVIIVFEKHADRLLNAMRKSKESGVK
jgi:hypothetical protein